MPDLDNVVGRWPNVAVEPGIDPHEVMKKYGVNEHTLRTEGGERMTVYIGEIETFPRARADKAQVVKICEETAEVFSAWEDYDRNGYLYSEERAHLVDECADTIQAICNLLSALSVDDMRPAMAACERRNRERGRYDGER